MENKDELTRLENWLLKNQEKAIAMIENHTDKNEEIVFYATGWSYPLEILTWIPIIGSIIEAQKKRYLLAVTKKKFLIIRLRKFRFEEISCEDIPFGDIHDSDVTQYPLFCNLSVNLSSGKNYLFKEMPYEWAAGIKDGIDEMQGKPSSVD